MTPQQIESLREAGVWPECLLCDSYRDGRFYIEGERGDWPRIPSSIARYALIDAMLDRLPDGWVLQPGFWMVEKTWRVYAVHDGEDAISHSPDKFHALYAALVAAGVVEEKS